MSSGEDTTATSSGKRKRRRRSSTPVLDDPTPHLRFRGDIEGLRAVAVLLVVLDHLNVPGFSGGFIGVDVFFVLSGFLITGLMRKEYRNRGGRSHHSQGSISFKDFYTRRARRILPAALTVIAVVLVAAKVLFTNLRFEQVQEDALWATFFGANFQLMHQATDYFAQTNLVSPLQNFWSLAVEEQFYIVWPALFLAATLFQKWSNKRIGWRDGVRFVSLVVFIASLAWSIYATTKSPDSAYFSPLTRAWELALGAGLAMRVTLTRKLKGQAAQAVAAGGIGLLALSLFVIGPGTPYPGAIALLPAFGTALILAAGVRRRNTTVVGSALAIPGPRWIGRISYSLYLWHWPIIVFAVALFPHGAKTVPVRLLLFGLSIGVAALSYYLIETPFRKLTIPKDTAESQSWMKANSNRATAMTIGALAVIGCIALLARPTPDLRTADVTRAQANEGVDKWANWTGQTGEPDSATSGGEAAPTQAEWRSALAAAVTQKKYSEAEMQLAASAKGLGPETSCYTITGPAQEDACRVTDTGASGLTWPAGANNKVVLVGNSIASQWRDSLLKSLPEHSDFRSLTLEGCDPTGAPGTPTQNQKGINCAQHAKLVESEVAKLKPALVVTSSVYTTPNQAMGRMLAKMKATGAKILWISPPPSTPTFEQCLRGTEAKPCNGPIYSQLEKIKWTSEAAKKTGATFLDLGGIFCKDNVCPAFVNNYPVHMDGKHLTAQTMLGVRSFLSEAIANATGAATGITRPKSAG